MPKRNVAEIFAVARLDTSGIPRELDRAVAKARPKVNVEVDERSFKASLKKLETGRTKPVKVAVEADTSSFRQSLAKLSQTVFKAVKVKVEADTSSFRNSLNKLSATTFKPVSVGVQADTKSFNASLTNLTQSDYSPVSVDVEAYTGGAAAEVDAFVARESAKDIDIDVNVDKNKLSKLGGQAGEGFMSSFMDTMKMFKGNMLAVALPAAVAAGPLIGATLGAGIVTALGGGLIAAGIATAMKNEATNSAFKDFRNKIFGLSKEDEADLKKQITQTQNRIAKMQVDYGKNPSKEGKAGIQQQKDALKKMYDELEYAQNFSFARATKGFQEPLQKGFKAATEFFLKLEPTFTRIFNAAAPLMGIIGKGLGEGLQKMLPGIENLTKKMTPIFEVIGQGAERIGAALGRMFNKFASDPEVIEGMSMALGDILGLVETLINYLGDFIVSTSKAYAQFKKAWGEVANWFSGTIVPSLGRAWDQAKAVFWAIVNWFRGPFVDFYVDGWNTVKGVFVGFVNWLKGPFAGWFINAWNGIKNWFSGLGKWFSDRWNGIKGVFTGAKNAVVVTWNSLWSNLSTKASGMMTSIKDGINNRVNTVKGIFSGLWNSATSTFKTGISRVGDQINNMKKKLDDMKKKFSDIFGGIKGLASAGLAKAAEAARSGLNGMIGFINKGIKAINKPLGWVNMEIPTISAIDAPKSNSGMGNKPKGFRTGGAVFGPGTETSDSIDARLSKGEHVWTAKEVKAIGGQGAMYALRRMARSGALKPGGTGGDVSEGIVAKFAKGGAITQRIADTQKWIRRQAGKPYVWASSGPGGYDCSGLVGAVYNMLRGANPHQRIFSTSNEQNFFKPGKGTFTAGYAHPGERGASSGVGHTAGNLAGLAFESRGSRGVIVGSQARSVDSFARQGYMPQAGNQFIGAGGGNGDIFGLLKEKLTPLLNKLWEGMPALGILGEFVKKSLKKFAGAIPGKVFDSGGMLNPGGVGINLGSKPEAVLTPKETQTYKQVAANGGGITIQGNLVVAPEISTVADILTVQKFQEFVRNSARGNGYGRVTA